MVLEPKGNTTQLKCIGKETIDKLARISVKLFIKRSIRPKYIKTSQNGLSSKGTIAQLLICNQLGKQIASENQNTLPKLALSKAMAYCLAIWNNLIAYLHDGALEIDNNLLKNAIRPVTLARKNELFAGSHRTDQKAAMILFFLCHL